nr:MAG TPA: hypothetical protein [Caudoviricetes sp.]
MAQTSVDIAMEKTSQEILEMCKIIRTMVTDVDKHGTDICRYCYGKNVTGDS